MKNDKQKVRGNIFIAALLFATAFLFLCSITFGLPKNAREKLIPSTQKPTRTEPARFKAKVIDEGELISPSRGISSVPLAPRYLGPSRMETAASPYVDVRVGIPETPGGGNHMRRQVALSSDGTVHMVYAVFNADPDGVVRNPADSNINSMYFYNAYNCSGSGALKFGSLDVQMMQVFSGIGDLRPRTMNQGGIFLPPGSNVPVVYGNRYVERADIGAGFFSRRGWATMADGASCLGLFTMDTSATITNRLHPVMYPLNESTWVATFRELSFPENIWFSYTIDRGLTWSAPQVLATYSPWYNSTDIAGSGNTFYVVSVADPSNPTAFMTSERPCYLKGTYNPLTGSITFGTMTDITGNFELPDFLANMLDISALMIGDTLHVLWTDWNNYNGHGFPGPGGHVHHAAVLPDGTILRPNKITDINIDGRLPARSYTFAGFAVEVWPMVSLSYNPTTGNLYALWSQPPDDGNFGWADYEYYHALACYDIFCAASPNNGRGWDDPQNVTQTDHPGCDGIITPCEHEDFFSTAERADSIVNVVAMVQRYPGFQSSVPCDIGCDPGPITEMQDVFRLYRVPSRTPVPSARPFLGVLPGDTTKLDSLRLMPRGGTTSVPMQLSNQGLAGFSVDSAKFTGTLNDGSLVTTEDATPGTFLAAGSLYNFNVAFNTSGVGSNNQGLRSGFLELYVHSDDPSVPPDKRYGVARAYVGAFVMITLCQNRKIRIHSGNNSTDVGTQGSIKDQAGNGMYYPTDVSDRFYDGGVAIANSGLVGYNCASGPRKVTRQLFGDKFLRCVADGILDSTAGSGYYNLFLKSLGTDVYDTTLVWQNIWEQSTHPDSSDFLIQTTRVINIGSTPIDSVAMGAIYDVDVTGILESENVSGDTVISYGTNTFFLGYTATNDVAIDTCAAGIDLYGAVVIPDSIGTLTGQYIRPRAQIMYDQVGFSYNIDCGNPMGGDTLAQRYMWNANIVTSTRRRTYDSLTGVWQDTSGIAPGHYFICGGPGAGATGAPYRNDEGYMCVAKKVYNFPVNGGGKNVVARYGLDGLAASMDTTFSGPGETYTIIHVGSVSGLADLIAHAITGIAWYANHANLQVGSRQTRLKGDLNNDGVLSPSDVVLELNDVFLGQDAVPWPPRPSSLAIPVCAADLNDDGSLSPVDVILLLNHTFANSGCPNCLRPCI